MDPVFFVLIGFETKFFLESVLTQLPSETVSLCLLIPAARSHGCRW
jgi:hypothetical protein